MFNGSYLYRYKMILCALKLNHFTSKLKCQYRSVHFPLPAASCEVRGYSITVYEAVAITVAVNRANNGPSVQSNSNKTLSNQCTLSRHYTINVY